jgi:hypothetical protein
LQEKLLQALCARTGQHFVVESFANCLASFHPLGPCSSGTSKARFDELQMALIDGFDTGLTFQSFTRTSED